MTKYEEFNDRIKRISAGKQGYRRKFALIIGVTPQTVYYWCTGKRHDNKTVTIPEYAWTILELLEEIWRQYPNQNAMLPKRWVDFYVAHGVY